MEHAKNPTDWDPEDCNACETLIKKLMVHVDVVYSEERWCLEAKLIAEFLSELHDFQNGLGPFASTHPWITVEDEDAIAHE